MEQKENKPNLDDWADFAGLYIKADLIKTFPVVMVPTSIETEYDKDQRPRLILNLEYNKKTWKFDVNKTNQMFFRNSGIKAPKELIGKKLTFDKIKVRNPTTNSMTDSLIVVKIE